MKRLWGRYRKRDRLIKLVLIDRNFLFDNILYVTHFTKHALEKFTILRQHNFTISKSAVLQTVDDPDLIDRSRTPLKIAQRTFDKDHVLRVVYKEQGDIKTIITFYPGRRTQYEK